MRQTAYSQFAQYTSEMTLPIVQVLEQRKTELWEQIKHQRDHSEVTRLQGIMCEIDEQIKHLTAK